MVTLTFSYPDVVTDLRQGQTVDCYKVLLPTSALWKWLQFNSANQRRSKQREETPDKGIPADHNMNS